MVFQYTTVSTNKKYDATELRTIQQYIVRPILHRARRHRRKFIRRLGETIPGAHQARPADLSYGITLQQVFEGFGKNNANASGNFIEHGSEQYVVRGLGLVKTPDIENIIVATTSIAPVYVRDVADADRRELRQGAVTANGEGAKPSRASF